MPRGQIKFTKEDKAWAKAVKDRDGWACVICGDKLRLNAHHIIARENHETKLDIQNGITLCARHHFFNRQISAHNNPLGFFMWLERNRPEQLEYLKTKLELIIQDGDL
jgi:predicted restriction endonuclease